MLLFEGNKAAFTAMVINRTINELININMGGEKVKDRVFITIICYGNPDVENVKSAYLSDLASAWMQDKPKNPAPVLTKWDDGTSNPCSGFKPCKRFGTYVRHCEQE
jgi:hypothetical protein